MCYSLLIKLTLVIEATLYIHCYFNHCYFKSLCGVCNRQRVSTLKEATFSFSIFFWLALELDRELLLDKEIRLSHSAQAIVAHHPGAYPGFCN